MYYVLKCEIIKKIFKFIFPLIDSPMKESNDCPYKLVWYEWTYLIHPLCLIELCLFQDRENNSGLGWCGQRGIRGCIRRNDTGFPYNNPICAAPHVGIWWEGVLAFKEVYPAWQISFYRNHTLMPLTSKPKATVARKGTPNNATGVIKYSVLITSAGIMTTAQVFSYMIQIPCFSCKIVFKWRSVIGSFKCTVVNWVQLESKMEGGGREGHRLFLHSLPLDAFVFSAGSDPHTHSVCKSQCLLKFAFSSNRQQ